MHTLTMRISGPQCENPLPYVHENSQRSKFSPAKLQELNSATEYLSIIFIFFILLLLNILHLQAIRYPQMRLTKIP